MSKIGNKDIIIPAGVTVAVQDGQIKVSGPKGQLSELMLGGVTVVMAENKVQVRTLATTRQAKANHGLIRSLIHNMVEGVAHGFTKKLELVGTGYRVAKKGQGLILTVGYSHPVEIAAVTGIELGAEGNTTISVSGASKYLVGQVAANIRKVRPPEPYKGKGIRYSDEVVHRKQGKTASTAKSA
jgi:large subunit ribosomal protein L6